MTSPKSRCSGEIRSRWRQRRSWSVLPGPADQPTLMTSVVGDEVSPDDVAEATLERTDRFPRGVPFGELAFVIAATGAVPVADLGDRRAMQRVVQPAVATP